MNLKLDSYAFFVIFFDKKLCLPKKMMKKQIANREKWKMNPIDSFEKFCCAKKIKNLTLF